MKRLLLSAGILVGLVLGGILAPVSAPVFADAAGEICQGIGVASGDGCDRGDELNNLVRNVINIFSVIIGVVAVIMIMVAGFKYITANGDSGNITSAKNTLIYAIVGLILAGLAQVIVQFVLESVN